MNVGVMLFGFWFLTWEFVIVTICLLFLAVGLVRITMQRQIEVLKDYLQPDKIPIEQIILNAEKLARQNNSTAEQPQTDSTENDSREHSDSQSL